MDLGKIFEVSWKDYKRNFRAILLLTLVLVGIPLVLSNVILFVMGMNDPVFYSAFVNEEIDTITPSFGIIIFLVFTISLVLYLIYEAGMLKDSMKGKFDFYKTISSGKRNFWKFVWFAIVTMFFLMWLFLAFVIPGIIFSIYWFLAIYVYLDSNKTVVESLRTSFHMVRGNWWRMFGYTLALFITLAVVGAIISLIGLPSGITVMSIEEPTLGVLFFDYVMQDIANFLNTLVSAPFAILFYKNIYLELRRKGRKKK
tara:strand:- start:228 stop:995 length:768 start_codon:yes stop_codon:yes gene_type:complete